MLLNKGLEELCLSAMDSASVMYEKVFARDPAPSAYLSSCWLLPLPEQDEREASAAGHGGAGLIGFYVNALQSGNFDLFMT